MGHGQLEEIHLYGLGTAQGIPLPDNLFNGLTSLKVGNLCRGTSFSLSLEGHGDKGQIENEDKGGRCRASREPTCAPIIRAPGCLVAQPWCKHVRDLARQIYVHQRRIFLRRSLTWAAAG